MVNPKKSDLIGRVMEQVTRRNFIKFSSAAVIATASTGLLSNVTRGDVAEEGVEEIEGLEDRKSVV